MSGPIALTAWMVSARSSSTARASCVRKACLLGDGVEILHPTVEAHLADAGGRVREQDGTQFRLPAFDGAVGTSHGCRPNETRLRGSRRARAATSGQSAGALPLIIA